MASSAGIEYLLSLPRFTDQGALAYKPGFERMDALVASMDQPHTAFQSVHVAGTNGKGSTASMLAAIATASGRRVGLHTSPHLYSVTERMRIDGAPAPEAWLDDAVARFRTVFDEVRPSFFEATVALSFLYFAEQKVDLAVVEVGLGGRLDATNIITPRLALITNIGLEHTDLLGDTHALIAREKAGIIKPGVPVLTAADHPEALAVIRTVAAEKEAPCYRVQDEMDIQRVQTTSNGLELDLRTPVCRYDGLFIGLPGAHQTWNAALAVRASEMLWEEVRHDSSSVFQGLRSVRRLSGLRGRFDVLQEHPAVIADVAHNAEGLAVTLEAVHPLVQAGSSLYVLFGAMRDKDVERMAALLRHANAQVYCVSVDSERALGADVLAGMLRKHGVAIFGAGPLREGLETFQNCARRDDVLLITGSHQVVSQVPGGLLT
ncbi:MAG TPA: folylpolyglutamate synthase/dihydrofolate synthase family protein [Rhodothermales bacterium]|nr:folylpolyglutamate synthase/dihydrofolate synthase family protein [Rhodothermales bacterium]